MTTNKIEKPASVLSKFFNDGKYADVFDTPTAKKMPLGEFTRELKELDDNEKQELARLAQAEMS